MIVTETGMLVEPQEPPSIFYCIDGYSSPLLFIEQCNFKSLNNISFYGWVRRMRIGSENTVAIWKIKWKV